MNESVSAPVPPEPPGHGGDARTGTAGLLIVLAAAFTVSQFYRTAPAVIGPELRSGLALSPAQLGLAAGAFFIAFSLMHVPIGVLLDRYGPRRVMATMLAIASAGAALFSQAGGAAGLVAAQLLIGAGCSAMFVGGLVVVARRFPPARFGGLAALLTSVSGLGMVLSGTPFAVLADAVGWRTGFLIAAALSLALAIVIFRAVPRRGERRPEQPAESFLRSVLDLGSIFRHGPVWGVIALAMVSYPSVIAVRGFWGGPYLADVHGADTIERGDILLVMSVATIVGAGLYALFERRTTLRMPFVYLAAGASALGFWLLALAPVSFPVQAALLFVLIGTFSFGSVLLLALARDMFPDRLTGRAITSVNFTSFLGAGLMQVIPGIVLGLWLPVDGHPPAEAYRVVFAGIGAVLLVAAAVFTLVLRRQIAEGWRRWAARRAGRTVAPAAASGVAPGSEARQTGRHTD
ncbi:MAG: MFS transporter [Rhodospirillaceae bacterium]|nr:MFS transporter [Rhodospirillaceae bacterium]